VVLVAVTWVYLLATSVQNACDDVANVSGLLFGAFYILTATVVYYRRRILASAWDAVVLGILPLAAAVFLAWILARSIQAARGAQVWSLAAIVGVGVGVGVGLILMLAARFALRSPFFAIPLESDTPRTPRRY